jgi:hypothetical protein
LVDNVLLLSSCPAQRGRGTALRKQGVEGARTATLAPSVQNAELPPICVLKKAFPTWTRRISRKLGLYPVGRWFESSRENHITLISFCFSKQPTVPASLPMASSRQ